MNMNATLREDFTARAKAMTNIHASTPTQPYIRNLQTQVELLHHGELTLPCTINHNESDNAWVCSPVTTYGSYVIEEIDRVVPTPLSQPLKLLCRSYRSVLTQTSADQTVMVNNWMLSTNLYPTFDSTCDHQALAGIIAQIRQRWPDHAIWFRSLNEQHNRKWMDALQALGFNLLPSRQVYLFDHQTQSRHANFRRDLKLLNSTSLTSKASAQFQPDDFVRAEALYRYLYLDKYSHLNPYYTATFMQHWHAAGLLEFWGLSDADGILQAVVGTFRQGDTISAPIVGYNTRLEQSLGLYRMLMAHVFSIAQRDELRINLSAGAAHFKRLRGGTPALEYSAVLSQHLTMPRRITLQALRCLTNHIGVPIMQRLEL